MLAFKGRACLTTTSAFAPRLTGSNSLFGGQRSSSMLNVYRTASDAESIFCRGAELFPGCRLTSSNLATCCQTIRLGVM